MWTASNQKLYVGEEMINTNRIHEIIKDVLLNDDEVNEEANGPKEGVEEVFVNGITAKYCLHKERLETHREEIKGMLDELPPVFKDGMSFLQGCVDKDDNLLKICGI